ncbi:hypothetical protein G7046_g4731 [Stylonectria norvegica]|nr:hypothetical protein G7046_g4731 [Stylonectria norvegica]
MSAAHSHAYQMAPTYDDTPEVAMNQSLPEVYNPPRQSDAAWSPQQSSVAPTYTSTAPGKHDNSATPAAAYGNDSTVSEKKRKGSICGCSLLVLVLAIIIAVLSAAVIGLAAGTGVATSNYNDANSKLEALRASFSSATAQPSATDATATSSGTQTATSSSATSTSTSYSNITNGCSDTNEKVTGDTYNPAFFDKPTFTMYCNHDTPNPALFSLFAPDFNGCMDACAAWNSYNTSKANCEAVSFIPLWSIVAFAVAGGAPGDCYLKPGPQSKSKLTDPNIGTEVHAALLKS